MTAFALPPFLAQAATSNTAAGSAVTPPSASSLLRDSAPPYAYNRPFLQPAPVWDYWFALLFPLLLIVCLVYKGIKVSHVRELPKQAAAMFGWILLSLGAAAIALQLFVRWTS